MADPPIHSDFRKDTANDTGMPPWVKSLGVIALVVVLLLVVLMLVGGGGGPGGGGHGSGRHTP
ncbi:MAG: hypothetical protein ACR2KK_23920 [Acidimicrobiales bacterium]